MYLVRYSKNFSKSYQKIVRGGLKQASQQKVKDTIKLLSFGTGLPQKYKDHQLKGNLLEYRECHAQGYLLIMYKIIDNELVLLLVDVG